MEVKKGQLGFVEKVKPIFTLEPEGNSYIILHTHRFDRWLYLGSRVLLGGGF